MWGMMEHPCMMRAQTMTFCFFLLVCKVHGPVQGIEKVVRWSQPTLGSQPSSELLNRFQFIDKE